jgi:anti-sigma regulatory factor (Ser/Thr protein kinase)
VCWKTAEDYACDRQAPGLARRFCSETISTALDQGPDLESVVDDAITIASELVTNSVNAGCGAVHLGLSFHRRSLRVTVEDDAPGEPQLIAASPEDERGRGLAITAALSDSWGVESVGPRKAVWAELPLTSALTNSLACGT